MELEGGHVLVVDEPTSVAGGGNAGPQPTGLFLASLSSCFALAVAWAARKRDLELPGLQVKATGVYDGPRFSRVRLEVSVDSDPDTVRPLLERAKQFCYVSNTLRTECEIQVLVVDT